MLSATVFAFFLVIVLVCLKTNAAKGGSVFLGLVLGLMMASTSLGPPILTAVNSIFEGITGVIGGLGG